MVRCKTAGFCWKQLFAVYLLSQSSSRGSYEAHFAIPQGTLLHRLTTVPADQHTHTHAEARARAAWHGACQSQVQNHQATETPLMTKLANFDQLRASRLLMRATFRQTNPDRGNKGPAYSFKSTGRDKLATDLYFYRDTHRVSR